MKITKTKKDKCPICYKKVAGKNGWCKYHITYKPEKTILACKFCNFTEFILRNSIKREFGGGVLTPWRVDRVVAYHAKFGVKL